ncbi:hypothetical protein KFZ70_07780 [Tamlana fucoidanivorans]|uniref:DUF5723 domain-containing protein n=1 Tax=Allotamlana fucoidanivorans TaxID=2583814 RepID=A0A5C4SKL6_9FLAO|nr:DUF5723 family protein [Tamlana fucoidanivorans]TNJ43775.1 hypothetical protein FGF67_10415 [Tamlana fucoidanivorans]
MKNYLTFWGLILFCLTSYTQNKQILYGFSEIPQALLLNPGGKITNKWYVGMPLLSHVHVSSGTTGSTVYDLFADNGVAFNTKFRKAIYGMSNKDFFSFNEQIDVFSGGLAMGPSYEKNQYLSFGLYQELDFIGYFPKDYVVLALEGNQNNINKIFDAGDLNATAEVISVVHVGYNKTLNSKMSFGFRGKIYSSVMTVSSKRNKGYFVTTQGQNNTYNHVFDLNLELKTSGISHLLDDDNSSLEQDLKTLRRRLFFGGNLGLGFDVGMSYQISNQWSVDGSLLDIGFIHHSKDIENYKVEGVYTFEGVNPIFPESGNNQSADAYWSEIEEDFEDLFQVDTTASKFTSWRPVKLNASINYAFGKRSEKECTCVKEDSGYLNAVGLQLYVIKRPRRPQLAITSYYYRKLFEWLRIKATYTVDSYSFSNIGMGVSAHWGAINFYLMADNFLEYKNIYDAEAVSLQLGFNYIFK